MEYIQSQTKSLNCKSQQCLFVSMSFTEQADLISLTLICTRCFTSQNKIPLVSEPSLIDGVLLCHMTYMTRVWILICLGLTAFLSNDTSTLHHVWHHTDSQAHTLRFQRGKMCGRKMKLVTRVQLLRTVRLEPRDCHEVGQEGHTTSQLSYTPALLSWQRFYEWFFC